jgi:hypothetical protein
VTSTSSQGTTAHLTTERQILELKVRSKLLEHSSFPSGKNSARALERDLYLARLGSVRALKLLTNFAAFGLGRRKFFVNCFSAHHEELDALFSDSFSEANNVVGAVGESAVEAHGTADVLFKVSELLFGFG